MPGRRQGDDGGGKRPGRKPRPSQSRSERRELEQGSREPSDTRKAGRQVRADARSGEAPRRSNGLAEHDHQASHPCSLTPWAWVVRWSVTPAEPVTLPSTRVPSGVVAAPRESFVLSGSEKSSVTTPGAELSSALGSGVDDTNPACAQAMEGVRQR